MDDAPPPYHSFNMVDPAHPVLSTTLDTGLGPLRGDRRTNRRMRFFVQQWAPRINECAGGAGADEAEPFVGRATVSVRDPCRP
jgi:hypothetical protein